MYIWILKFFHINEKEKIKTLKKITKIIEVGVWERKNVQKEKNQNKTWNSEFRLQKKNTNKKIKIWK